MVDRPTIIIAWVCCFFVVASFSLFAIDQMAGASRHQQNEITSSAVQPIPPVGPARHSVDRSTPQLRRSAPYQ